MSYSQLSITNLALGRIGVAKIGALGELTPQDIAATTAWEFVRDEVLEARDWRFAKLRVVLGLNATTPLYGWDYAYTLPTDFLRLCQQSKEDPNIYPGEYNGVTYPYVIEVLSTGVKVLLSNFDNTNDDIYINYIKKETDPSKWTPAFVNAFAFRLAAELALPLTAETINKYNAMITLYDNALHRADAINRSLDYHPTEIGTEEWEMAGRNFSSEYLDTLQGI